MVNTWIYGAREALSGLHVKRSKTNFMHIHTESCQDKWCKLLRLTCLTLSTLYIWSNCTCCFCTKNKYLFCALKKLHTSCTKQWLHLQMRHCAVYTKHRLLTTTFQFTESKEPLCGLLKTLSLDHNLSIHWKQGDRMQNQTWSVCLLAEYLTTGQNSSGVRDIFLKIICIKKLQIHTWNCRL